MKGVEQTTACDTYYPFYHFFCSYFFLFHYSILLRLLRLRWALAKGVRVSSWWPF